MDPTKLALINDGEEGHEMAWINEHWKKEEGFNAKRDSLREVLKIGKKVIDWYSKWHLPGTKILPNGKYHGIGVTWQQGWNDSLQKCIAAVAVLKDGTANVIAPHAMGAGVVRPITVEWPTTNWILNAKTSIPGPLMIPGLI